MFFRYVLLCSAHSGGVQTVKLNGKLLYFAALNAFSDRRGNFWLSARAMVRQYIKGIQSGAQLHEATRLFTFIALNKVFGVNNMAVITQLNNHNCYMAYNSNRPDFHFFGVCVNRQNLNNVLNIMRHVSVTPFKNYHYAAVFDVASNMLTIIDPPSESNERIDDEFINKSERDFRQRLYRDFVSLHEFDNRVISYENESYKVIDFKDINLRVGLNVKFVETDIAKQYISTENIIISNGIYFEQL